MNQMIVPKFGLGADVDRVEDRNLITGHGHYVADYMPTGALHAVLVRSPIAAGTFRIVGGLEEARAAPGVHLVLTHDDVAALGPLPSKGVKTQVDGSDTPVPDRFALCRDEVRHVGDPVAMVVADSVDQAEEAAELIEIDWNSRESVADAGEALKEGAPLVWPQYETNRAFRYAHGDRDATEAAFAKAAHVARLTLVNNRLVTNYMETRGAVGEYDAASGRYTLTVGSQGGHSMKGIIAADVLKVDPDRLRVVTPDVGGGFGTKIFVYPEYPLVLVAAERLGRPVKWISTRQEAFQSDSQGRDNITEAEVAMDESGRFTALRVDLKANMGAYLHQFAPHIPWVGTTMAPGLYDIPTMHVLIDGVYTNTVPVDAYRGAGRPEAAYVIERLVDEAARVVGMDPADMRRLNFIKPEQLPYTTAAGRTYDTGEFEGHMNRALEVIDHAGFPAREAESRAAGRIRGIGISSYIEACAFPGAENAEVSLGEDGSVTLLIGTQTNGQGHATAYGQLIADKLGIDMDRIRVIQGDTDIVKTGGGTGGSRSVPLGAPSVLSASETLAAQLKDLASEELEAAAEDLELSGGAVRVVGTDRAVDLADLARKAEDKGKLQASGRVKQTEPTFPNGTHVCELEIDPATGVTEILRYVIVDDFGVTVNPRLLAGQVHGGVVQGIGQALMENTVYDAEGQLVTASLLDYALPRAEDIPFFHFETRNVPSTHNPLGIKGAGEAGTIGACGAVMNAIVDALWRNYGIRHVDMPMTPARMWAVIDEATRAAAE